MRLSLPDRLPSLFSTLLFFSSMLKTEAPRSIRCIIRPSLTLPQKLPADGNIIPQVVYSLQRRPIRRRIVLERQIEEAALKGWPALHQRTLDGWLLRSSNGYTKIASSVTPLWPLRSRDRSSAETERLRHTVDHGHVRLGVPAWCSLCSSTGHGGKPCSTADVRETRFSTVLSLLVPYAQIAASHLIENL